jgi:hypothetical protein
VAVPGAATPSISGLAVEGVPPPLAACSALISDFAVAQLARWLAVVGVPVTGTVASMLLVMLWFRLR